MTLKLAFIRTLYFILAINLLTSQFVSAQTHPEFLAGQDPKPVGKRWALVDELSDDFDGSELNKSKWQNTDSSRWIGRPPGIFKRDSVSVADSELRITNYELDEPEWHNGNVFTHAGGHVISRTAGQVGYYFEARMKANKTFMSSTFWLINYRNEQTGCNQRTTELDIQECVGQVTTSASWAQSFDESMHSNTHSRNVSCNDPTGSRGNNVSTGGKVWADYHTFGAWWKSPTEILFFLDGNFVYSVTPYADFDIEMYIKLVTETYDWNPVPADGGMNGTWTERTTFYEWVRTWELVDSTRVTGKQGIAPSNSNGLIAPSCDDTVSFSPAPEIPSQTSYTISVDYTACQERDIVLEFWNDNWLASARTTVDAGSGSVDLTVNLNVAPPPGNNYLWKASIRPVGTSWQSNLDLVQQNNITVTAGALIPDGRYVLVNKANNKNLGAPLWSEVGNNYNAITVDPGDFDDQKWDFTHLGGNVYEIKLVCCNRYLDVPLGDCSNGSNVSTWTSADDAHQKWRLVRVGKHFMLKPTHCETHALDRNPDSGTKQTYFNDNVHLWSASATNDNQLWQIVPDDTP